MPDPLVSVVIPTHARPGLLRRATESVLCQSYENLEVIVIDDSSEGDGLRMCHTIDDPRLRAYRNRRSTGACGARNTGIELARGTFYTGLDDDDIFHEDRIGVLLDAYQPKYSFVASNILQLRDAVVSPRFRGEREIALRDILWGNCVGNQIFSEVSKVREIGAFAEHLVAGQDFDLWIRMIERWGHALRIAGCLYVMDVGHEDTRITTSVPVSRRIRDFLYRHGDKLTTAQRLLYSARAKRDMREPYVGSAIASLAFASSWNYWIKRWTRAW